jgi:hypothetical protein
MVARDRFRNIPFINFWIQQMFGVKILDTWKEESQWMKDNDFIPNVLCLTKITILCVEI